MPAAEDRERRWKATEFCQRWTGPSTDGQLGVVPGGACLGGGPAHRGIPCRLRQHQRARRHLGRSGGADHVALRHLRDGQPSGAAGVLLGRDGLGLASMGRYVAASCNPRSKPALDADPGEPLRPIGPDGRCHPAALGRRPSASGAEPTARLHSATTRIPREYVPAARPFDSSRTHSSRALRPHHRLGVAHPRSNMVGDGAPRAGGGPRLGPVWSRGHVGVLGHSGHFRDRSGRGGSYLHAQPTAWSGCDRAPSLAARGVLASLRRARRSRDRDRQGKKW